MYEGDVISYTDSSIETVTDVKENGDFYTKITSTPKLPLKDMDTLYLNPYPLMAISA